MRPSKITLKEILDSPSHATIRFSFERDAYQSERAATEYVVQQAMEKTSSRDLLEKIRFVAGEMISNAREYGNKLDPKKDVQIDHCWKGNDFYFVVRDHGEGFNMDSPPEHGTGFESGIGIRESKKSADIVYNFQDSAAYVCFRLPVVEKR